MSQAQGSKGVLEREQTFHDELSMNASAGEMPLRPLDPLEKAVLRYAGHVAGLKVLDLGCGVGDLTLALAQAGAVVTGLDLSPGMVRVTSDRIRRFIPQAQAEVIVAPAEATSLPDATFDLVVGKWVLHHTDIESTALEVRRILKPEGRAIFAENSGLNPFLMFARNRLTGRLGIPRYGTPDEHPLVSADYAVYRRIFSEVSLDYPDFCFFQLLDRQIARFRFRSVSRVAAGLDAMGGRIRGLRKYSYHVIVQLASSSGTSP